MNDPGWLSGRLDIIGSEMVELRRRLNSADSIRQPKRQKRDVGKKVAENTSLFLPISFFAVNNYTPLQKTRTSSKMKGSATQQRLIRQTPHTKQTTPSYLQRCFSRCFFGLPSCSRRCRTGCRRTTCHSYSCCCHQSRSRRAGCSHHFSRCRRPGDQPRHFC